MKKIVFLMGCLFLSIGLVNAQDWYFTWTAGAAYQYYPGNPGQLQISFPYTVTDQNGNTSQQQFSSRNVSPYQSAPVLGMPFWWELGNLKNNFTLGVAAADRVAHFSLGYGRNFYFDLPGAKARDVHEKSFVLKPSLNIVYSSYHNHDKNGSNYLGSIDNYDKTVSFGANESGPTYTLSSSDDNTPPETDSTSILDLYYIQHVWAAMPKITLSSNQYKHTVHWNISCGYYLPFSVICGLKAYQNDNNAIKNISTIGTNGIAATFDQKPITAAPFRFSGIFVGASVGFSMSQWHMRYRSHRRNRKNIAKDQAAE